MGRKTININLGISFSLHRCSELGIDPKQLLKASLKELGIRRFRLMSYWNIHEPEPGKYDFTKLDLQMDMIAKYQGAVTLCLGKRQPRWPECHMPDWARSLPKKEWYEALYAFVQAVVERYKDHPALESWQLENEALLKDFGYCPDGDYSHKRLRKEAELVRSLDPSHPLIMTLSDSWGLPWRRPTPHIYGISLYRQTTDKNGNIHLNNAPVWIYKLRCQLIRIIKRRPVFVHELQAEPWLSTAIKEASVNEQVRLFNATTLQNNVVYARSLGLNQPMYLWGLEWWYWMKVKNGVPELWNASKSIFIADN